MSMLITWFDQWDSSTATLMEEMGETQGVYIEKTKNQKQSTFHVSILISQWIFYSTFVFVYRQRVFMKNIKSYQKKTTIKIFIFSQQLFPQKWFTPFLQELFVSMKCSLDNSNRAWTRMLQINNWTIFMFKNV